jgi:hypothetical protein
LDRRERDVCPPIVAPPEQVRLEPPRPYFDDYLSLINRIVPIGPLELLCDPGRTEYSDSENWKNRPALALSAAEDSRFQYAINKSIRHHTLLCRFTALSDSHYPKFIASNTGARHPFDARLRDWPMSLSESGDQGT